MGYILPVENFQYQQYHKRVTNNEHDPFPIEKLYPIQSNRQYDREKSEEKKDLNYEQPDLITRSKTPLPSTSIKNEKVYAEVTGKGRQFVAAV